MAPRTFHFKIPVWAPFAMAWNSRNFPFSPIFRCFSDPRRQLLSFHRGTKRFPESKDTKRVNLGLEKTNCGIHALLIFCHYIVKDVSRQGDLLTLMAAGKQQGDSSTLFTESGVGKFILTSVLLLLYMEAQICSRSRAQVFHTDRPVNNLFSFFCWFV